MLCWIRIEKNDENWPRVYYVGLRSEEDPFPDPSLFDPIESDEYTDIMNAVITKIHRAAFNGLPWIFVNYWNS